jgi:predicted  nucleic acid-binding Zn-ribbon protein
MHKIFLLLIAVAAREAELRQLRKSNTDYEQQNAILQKHIENMKAAVEKLEVETMQQRNNNVALQQHLDHMRATLTASFQNIALPGKVLINSSLYALKQYIILLG